MKRSGRLTEGLKRGFFGTDSCGNESAEVGVAGADDEGENKSLLFLILRTAFLRSGVGVHQLLPGRFSVKVVVRPRKSNIVLTESFNSDGDNGNPRRDTSNSHSTMSFSSCAVKTVGGPAK